MNALASLFSVSSGEKFAKLKKVLKNKDENWEEKAIEILNKRLAKQPNALDNLKEALQKKNSNTPCVTIARTQDGRIQINHRKRYPHFIYCKLWRWSDLKSHNELKPTGYCNKSFYSKSKDDKNNNEVCINPYHYEREQPNVCASSPSLPYSSPNSLSISNSSFNSSIDQRLDHSIDQHLNNSNDNSMNNISTNNLMNNSLDATLFHSCYSEFNSLSNHALSYSTDQTNSRMNFNMNNNNIEINYPYRELNYNPIATQNYNLINYQTITSNQMNVSNPMNVSSYRRPWCTVAFFEYKNRQNKKTIICNQDVINCQDVPKYLNSNQGIRLFNENGEYFIESYCKVFIQSAFLNAMKQWNLNSIVELPLMKVKIFDENMFRKLIDNHRNTNFEQMSSLTKYAKCNLSFQYCWNEHNIHITQMPCWLEIQMNLALTELNEALSTLSLPPKEQATSMS